MSTSASVKRTGCLVILGITVVVVGACYLSTVIKSPSAPSRPTSLPRELNAAVRYDASSLTVTNNDRFAWLECEITLNNSYKYSAGTIGSGMSKSYPLAQFAKSGGERFNVFAVKPQSVFIAGETPDGRARWYGTFK